MAELADAEHLKCFILKDVWVQVPLSAFKKNYLLDLKTLELYSIVNDMWSH